MSNDIKINVKADADLGGISAAMDKINQKAVDLQTTLGKTATIDVDNTQALSKIKEVGQADEESKRRVSGVPASSTSETPEELSIKRKQQRLKELTEEVRKHTNLKRELNEVDLKAYSNATNRMANSGSALGAYAAAAGDDPKKLAEISPAASKHALASTGMVDANKAKTGAASQYGGKLAGAAIGMAGGMVAGGAGGDGMATAGSALGGMVGSMFGPVGSMIGGALGGLAGGVVGGGLGDAKDEAIGITDLRHSLGATTTDFTLLREAARAAASGMGMTSIESTRLAKQFSHNANTQSKDAGSLSAEIRLASGFSRSLGLDPSQGVEAMSTLRNTRVTTDEAGSRKMAMTIADAISKGGMSSKGDEVLSAIASFAQANARASLQTPNVTGYADYMSRMVGMKTPGLDVQGSASLLGKADAGIRSHSDLASEVFKLGAFTKAFGNNFTAPDMDLYTAQGAFGTAEGVATDIAHDKTATPERRKSAQDVLDSKNAKRPIQDIMMDQLGTIAPRGSALYEQAGAHLFGMEHNEFRKYQQTYNTEGGSVGMKSRLDAMGVNTAKLDSSKFMHMGALLGSNKNELKAEGEKLISGNGYSKGLDETQKEELQGLIDHGSEKELREKVIKLQEGRELTDIGTATRNNTADIKQQIINLSTALMPAIKGVQDAILLGNGSSPAKLAAAQKNWELDAENKKIENEANQKFPSGGWAGDENYDKRRDFIAKKKKEASDTYDAKHAPKQDDVKIDDDGRPISIISGGGRVATGKIYRPGAPDDAKQDLQQTGQALSGAMRGKAEQVLSESQYDELFKESAAKHGVNWRDLKQLAVQESGLKNVVSKPNKNGTVDRGIMQLNSAFDKARGVTNPLDPKQNIDAGGAVWAKALKDSGGDVREAFRRYNGAGPKAEDYADKATAVREYTDKVPAKDPALIKASFGQGATSDSQEITIIVKSAENKFSPEKVKVSIPGRSKTSGASSRVI